MLRRLLHNTLEGKVVGYLVVAFQDKSILLHVNASDTMNDVKANIHNKAASHPISNT